MKIIKTYFEFDSDINNPDEVLVAKKYSFDVEKTEDEIVTHQTGFIKFAVDPNQDIDEQVSERLKGACKTDVEVFNNGESIGFGTLE